MTGVQTCALPISRVFVNTRKQYLLVRNDLLRIIAGKQALFKGLLAGDKINIIRKNARGNLARRYFVTS